MHRTYFYYQPCPNKRINQNIFVMEAVILHIYTFYEHFIHSIDEKIRVEQPSTAKQEFYLRFVLLRIGDVVVIVFHKNCENAIKKRDK